MAGFYSREYAQRDTMQRAANLALGSVASELSLQAALANAGAPVGVAVGYGYADDGTQIDYYRVGDIISSTGVLVAPSQ